MQARYISVREQGALSVSRQHVHVCALKCLGLEPFLLAQLKLGSIPPTLRVTRHFLSQGTGGGENLKQLTERLNPLLPTSLLISRTLRTREGNKVAKVTQQWRRHQSKLVI